MDEFSAGTPEDLVRSLTSAFLRECTAIDYQDNIAETPEAAFKRISLVARRDERYFAIYLDYLERRQMLSVLTSFIIPGGIIGSDLRAAEWKVVLSLTPPYRIEMYRFPEDGGTPDYAGQLPERYLGPTWLKEAMHERLSAQRS